MVDRLVSPEGLCSLTEKQEVWSSQAYWLRSSGGNKGYDQQSLVTVMVGSRKAVNDTKIVGCSDTLSESLM